MSCRALRAGPTRSILSQRQTERRLDWVRWRTDMKKVESNSFTYPPGELLMDETEQKDPGDFDAAPNETRSRGAPGRAVESFWKRLFKLLSVLGVSGILGSAVGAYFQQRAWNNEKAVTKRHDDATKAFDVEQKVSVFIDSRWAAADQIGRAIQSHASKEEWQRARDEYYNKFEEWQSNLTKWAAQLAFRIDTPFKRKTDDRRREINNSIQCLTYTLDIKLDKENSPIIDSQSASHLLQIIDHCHDLAKSDIEQATADKNPVKAPASCDGVTLSKVEKHICDFATRKSHIWWLNNVLRCTILQRAVTMRDDVAKTFWEKYIMPKAPSNYDLMQDASDDCVRDYHDDERFGSAGTSGRQ